MAQIYIDPSFPDPASLTPEETAAYSYFGCFGPQPQAPVFPPLSYRVQEFPFELPEQCFEFCAGLGFPYAGFDGTPNQ